MKTIIHKAESRGTAFFGWLHSRHTFSFGRYYNAERMNFGALRVLNDDIVEGGQGFGTHPHDNMEIVSIPLKGNLAHKDSTGATKVIREGDVQIMSAGSGLSHSEFNHSATDKVNFLQIWIMPKARDIEPRYQQISFKKEDRRNKLQVVVAPDNESAVWINQDAWLTLADVDAGNSLTYDFHKPGHGSYVFVIAGDVTVNGEQLETRDAIGVTETDNLNITAAENAQLLIIEVPMAM